HRLPDVDDVARRARSRDIGRSARAEVPAPRGRGARPVRGADGPRGAGGVGDLTKPRGAASRGWAAGDGQRLQRVEGDERTPLWLVNGEFEARHGDECGERDLGLRAGERGSEAVVSTAAECNVAMGIAG